MRISDWSSDVCSSDLQSFDRRVGRGAQHRLGAALTEKVREVEIAGRFPGTDAGEHTRIVGEHVVHKRVLQRRIEKPGSNRSITQLATAAPTNIITLPRALAELTRTEKQRGGNEGVRK